MTTDNRTLFIGVGSALAVFVAIGAYSYLGSTRLTPVDTASTMPTAAAMATQPKVATHVTVPRSVMMARNSASVSSSIGGTGNTVSKPVRPPVPLRDAVADNAMIAVSGTVTAKKGDVLMIAEAAGPVRVVVREESAPTWDLRNTTTAMNNIGVGDPVTVYGKVHTATSDKTPRINADAVYAPAKRTLYYVSGDQPDNMTSQAITAKYVTVRGPTAPTSLTKVMSSR